MGKGWSRKDWMRWFRDWPVLLMLQVLVLIEMSVDAQQNGLTMRLVMIALVMIAQEVLVVLT